MLAEQAEIRAIQKETRRSLQQDTDDATTPHAKLKKVLAAISSGVDTVFVEENAVRVLMQTATEQDVQQKLRQRLDELAEETTIIGEGAGATWANGVDALSFLVDTLFHLQCEESCSKLTTDHRDNVRDAMTKVVSQVLTAEAHIMRTRIPYELLVSHYKDFLTEAEQLLNTLKAEMEVLREHFSALKNTSLANSLVELFCDVPKVQLCQALKNVSHNLGSEMYQANKHMDDIINIFKAADADRNGVISKLELMRVFFEIGQWTQEQLDKLFEDADVNDDGNLQYTEFVQYLIPQMSADDRILVDAMDHYAIAEDLFEKYDKDRSGFINAKEVKAFFKEHEGEKIKKKQAQKYLSDWDMNGDKKVDCIEFIQYLNRKEHDNALEQECDTKRIGLVGGPFNYDDHPPQEKV